MTSFSERRNKLLYGKPRTHREPEAAAHRVADRVLSTGGAGKLYSLRVESRIYSRPSLFTGMNITLEAPAPHVTTPRGTNSLVHQRESSDRQA